MFLYDVGVSSHMRHKIQEVSIPIAHLSVFVTGDNWCRWSVVTRTPDITPGTTPAQLPGTICRELRLGYGLLNFQQALKHCSAKTIFMYLQAHLNFMCTFDSDMKFSLDFWQKHIKIYFPLLRSTKVCLIHSFVSRVMHYLYYFSLTRVLISFISMV